MLQTLTESGIIGSKKGKNGGFFLARKPEKIKLIEESIEREINPNLKKDAGRLELVDVDGNRVMVRFGGSCASCVKSPVTLKHYVEKYYREYISNGAFVTAVMIKNLNYKTVKDNPNVFIKLHPRPLEEHRLLYNNR